MLVTLKSVGTIINTETLITYPLCTNGKPDLDNQVHLNYCSDEWFGSLGENDRKIIEEFTSIF